MIFILLISGLASAQEECDQWSTKDEVDSVVGVAANCSLLSSISDQWFCRGLKSKNCSVVTDYRKQDLCRALVTKNCSYPKDLDDQAFCRGTLTRHCSYISDFRQQALCRGITNNYCSHVDPEDYWLCVTLVDVL